eukprot:SAG11_NODE_2107_length_3810_cov_7.214228_4_plen_63_part_00
MKSIADGSCVAATERARHRTDATPTHAGAGGCQHQYGEHAIVLYSSYMPEQCLSAGLCPPPS